MSMKDNATIAMLTKLLDRKESVDFGVWWNAVEEAISEIERLEQMIECEKVSNQRDLATRKSINDYVCGRDPTNL